MEHIFEQLAAWGSPQPQKKLLKRSDAGQMESAANICKIAVLHRESRSVEEEDAHERQRNVLSPTSPSPPPFQSTPALFARLLLANNFRKAAHSAFEETFIPPHLQATLARTTSLGQACCHCRQAKQKFPIIDSSNNGGGGGSGGVAVYIRPLWLPLLHFHQSHTLGLLDKASRLYPRLLSSSPRFGPSIPSVQQFYNFLIFLPGSVVN
ncbi:hypothetical protein T03_18190 [Trichinella britovi]|uniref:Uncharacterized protein n=1 Tax=Trichinella britovi TaxID=45882 RepID=A0A0V1C6M8_TRIBR|nr:hypothetical protein T03_18190 [Trichinella britovi]